ncbi:helix-turn-helix transcriptional regulator [Acidimangrovimonas pyrenivorans]|uniref:LuxR C-terminal-related transcriptional regulator n=1 Tax=Acidimangrovimonas pyrenivorans TaxID=2030798 RepID=A0ABV7AIN7_9RHOB
MTTQEDRRRPDAFVSFPLEPEDIARLDNYANRDLAPGKWIAFHGVYEDGRRDEVAVRVNGEPDEAAMVGFLSTIWPVLRGDCLREAREQADQTGDEALLWMISTKIDIGVMVMNAKGIMLKANASARALLRQGYVLRPGRWGIAGVNDRQTRLFREAVANCAVMPAEESEVTLFLESSQPDRKVPITLSRFCYKGEPTDLVTVMMPSPPDSKRVERLARALGLTRSEARVAALLQLGMSNRSAARIAGLTEQSFSTYSKRVLGKLKLNSRAEIAQMLTWQAYGGRQ